MDSRSAHDLDAAARTICLRLLTIRARTRAELADKLVAREIPVESIDRVLGRLGEVGLVDDQAFATSFASSRQRDRGLAAAEISRQLKSKGVEAAVISEAVSAIDATAEWATARRLVDRKLRSMSQLEPAVQTRRLVGLLARKGYSPALAFGVVKEALGAAADALAETDEIDAAWLA